MMRRMKLSGRLVLGNWVLAAWWWDLQMLDLKVWRHDT
jgi:hypothetical protein